MAESPRARVQNRLVVFGVAGALAGYAACARFLLDPLSRQAGPIEAARALGMPGMIGGGIAAGVLLLLLIPRRTRVWSLGILVAAAACAVVALPLERSRRPRFEAAVMEFDRQTAPLIDALQKYVADHGAPPNRLEELVPRYLPSLPRTRLGKIALHAEDPLRVPRLRATWSIAEPAGDLVIDLNSRYDILKASMTGVGHGVSPQPFDSAAWHRDARFRAPMVDEVLRRFRVGTPFAPVPRLLGTPENEVALDHPMWWLELTPLVLVYSPTELGPERLEFPLVEHFGRWRKVDQFGTAPTKTTEHDDHDHAH